MRLPKNFVLKKNKCSFVFLTKEGLISASIGDKRNHEKEIRYKQYGTLLCVLNGHLKISFMPYYPKIFIFNEEDYLEQLKISLLAKHAKIQCLPIEKIGEGNMSIFAFNNTKEDKLRAIIYLYMHVNKFPNELKDIEKYIWAYYQYSLRGVTKKEIYTYVLRQYILSKINDHKKKVFDTRKAYTDEYKKMQKNNFAEFNAFYKNVKDIAQQHLEKILNSADFKRFYEKKEKEIFNFEFDFNKIKDKSKKYSNMYYEKELKKLEKDIKRLNP